MTGLALISGALVQLGVLQAGDTADATDSSTALSRLNDLIDSFGTERATIYYILRTVQTLTASTASYTIGTGGTINIARPVWIDSLGLILDTAATVPVEAAIPLLTDQQWQHTPLKTLTAALPQAAYYDHNWSAGLGRIYPWPIPTVSTTQLVIYSPVAVTQFADLVTDYTFPPGYARFLRLQLALELSPEYGKPVDPLLVTMALESKADIKRANHRTAEMGMDAALLHTLTGVYSIWSDSNGGGR